MTRLRVSHCTLGQPWLRKLGASNGHETDTSFSERITTPNRHHLTWAVTDEELAFKTPDFSIVKGSEIEPIFINGHAAETVRNSAGIISALRSVHSRCVDSCSRPKIGRQNPD